MYLLIILFILVVLISFFLALYSMRNFEMKPDSKVEYGTFLFRNLSNINPNSFAPLLEDLAKDNLLISFERLFKGREGVLIVYGPKNILANYRDQFNLLELEDYTNFDISQVSVFEVDVRDVKGFRENLPNLLADEQLWIQIILKNKAVRTRVVLTSESEGRLKELTEQFQEKYKSILPKVPKPYSKAQIFEFYKNRSFITESGKDVNLKIEDILNLWFFL